MGRMVEGFSVRCVVRTESVNVRQGQTAAENQGPSDAMIHAACSHPPVYGGPLKAAGLPAARLVVDPDAYARISAVFMGTQAPLRPGSYHW